MSDDYVKAGDLITAELWNRMVGRVQQVEDRLTQFVSDGGLGQIMISSTNPADNIREGSTLTIYGINFGRATEGIDVRIDTTSYKDYVDFDKSDDRKLILYVPTLGLDPGGPGRDCTITVSNRKSSDSVKRRFLPAPVVVSGNIYVDYVQTASLSVPASGTLNLPFEIHSEANVTAQFDLQARVVGTGFSARVLNAPGGSELIRVSIAPGTTATCVVEVTIPPGSTGTRFAVGLLALSGSVQGISGLVSLVAGQTTAKPSNDFLWRFQHAIPSGTATFDWSTETTSVAVASAMRLGFRSSYTVGGNYTIQVKFLAPNMNDDLANWDYEESFWHTPTNGYVDDFEVNVAPTSPSATAGYVRITITQTASGESQVRYFGVQRT